MRFLLDEMLPAAACLGPIDLGHDAVHVCDRGLVGRPDALIAERARAEERVLVTENVKDFADEPNLVLAFVLKSRLSVPMAVSLARVLHAWAEKNPTPYPGPHWPPSSI